MKNKTGLIGGFLCGLLIGFLAIVVLSTVHPEEDLAGITLFLLLSSGSLFAVIGALLHSYFMKKV